jgi:uncharacterized membrane protein
MTHVCSSSIGRIVAMNHPAFGWALAALAIVGGAFGWGWRGVVLALSVTVFWLLLQFSRTLRVMRRAAASPVGTTASALMLHSKLARGQRLLEILPLAGSLGEKLAESPGTFVWRDAGGDAVRVELRAGRLSSWRLERAGS